MQSTNMLNDEQIQNGGQRSPLDALDKAIGTADTSFSLLETLREPEEIREVHVSSPVEMKIPESQGSSAEKAASSTVRPTISTDPPPVMIDEHPLGRSFAGSRGSNMSGLQSYLDTRMEAWSDGWVALQAFHT